MDMMDLSKDTPLDTNVVRERVLMALHCLQLYQMQMLTHGCQPGDSLVFHYSGKTLPDQPVLQASGLTTLA